MQQVLSDPCSALSVKACAMSVERPILCIECKSLCKSIFLWQSPFFFLVSTLLYSLLSFSVLSLIGIRRELFINKFASLPVCHIPASSIKALISSFWFLSVASVALFLHLLFQAVGTVALIRLQLV